MNSENKQESEPNDTTITTVQPSAKNVCCGIYGLRNKIDGKWYVGQSWNVQKRWREYERYDCESQPKLYKALKKYRYDTFEKRIIEWCDRDIPQEMLDIKETSWIHHLNSVEHGYNLRSGGSRGKHSEETKQKLRHRVITDATRKKISLNRRGRKLSAGHKQSIAKSLSNRHREPLSDDIRQKISRSLIGRFTGKLTNDRRLKNQRYDNTEYVFYNITTNEVVKCFRSDLLRLHTNLNNTGLRKLTSGKWKRYKNWIVKVS